MPSGAVQSPQWISTCSREKENQERMDVRLPKNMADELGLKQTEACLDAARQKELCCGALQKSEVLSQ